MYLKSHELSRLVELYLEHESKYGKWEIILDKFNSQFDKDLSMEQARQKVKYLRKTGRLTSSSTVEDKPKRVGTVNKEIKVIANPKPMKKTKTVDGKKFTEEVRFNENGVYYSTKLIEMNEEEEKDESYIMKAHGFDPRKWKCLGVKNKFWYAYSKLDKTVTLYSSAISIKPKETHDIDIEALEERINNLRPFSFDINITPQPKGERMLEIFISDPHLGISKFEDYEQTQKDIIALISSNPWAQLLIPIGSDLFHHNNHRSQTASGTIIENVDMNQAWIDGERLYFPIFDLATTLRIPVVIKFIPGNHDESISWAFVKMIKRLYPHFDVDDEFEMRKVHLYENVFIGLAHGDKARKDLPYIFAMEFPIEWSKGKVREIHIGHLHKEDATDYYGATRRTLATRNKTDKWHRDNGYIGNHKRFMLFEYSTTELRHIHYV